MNISRSVSNWDDERDAQFFRLTADVFSAEFCLGASVLLASYDVDEPVAKWATPAVPSAHSTSKEPCAIAHQAAPRIG